MRYRSVDAIDAGHIGRRVTVRRRLEDGMLSDVIGILEEADGSSVVVRDRHGTRIEVERAAIVAARVIEPPRAR